MALATRTKQNRNIVKEAARKRTYLRTCRRKVLYYGMDRLF